MHCGATDTRRARDLNFGPPADALHFHPIDAVTHEAPEAVRLVVGVIRHAAHGARRGELQSCHLAH